jgi:L-amino acid N-acyltransferase YncA
MDDLHIRPARADDLGAINDIYNYYVERSTCTFQTEPETAEDRAAWFSAHDAAHPVIVAEVAGEVVGWGSLSRFHSRCAYRFTVETSVYVRHDALAKGIGHALMVELIVRARAAGHHSIIGAICTENAPSLALGEKLGFVKVGHLHEVGFKFDRWLDVAYMQLIL